MEEGSGWGRGWYGFKSSATPISNPLGLDLNVSMQRKCGKLNGKPVIGAYAGVVLANWLHVTGVRK